MKHYYEIVFSSFPLNESEGDKADMESICIVGTRKPTFEEATEFCKEDMINNNLKEVWAIFEISPEEAQADFEMENEENFPIFS